jgi:hypothetical protein
MAINGQRGLADVDIRRATVGKGTKQSLENIKKKQVKQLIIRKK